MNPLAVIQEHGLTVQVIEGGNLYVTPREKLNDEIRDYIRQHKPDVIHALQTRWNPEMAAVGYVWCLDCRYWGGGGADNPNAGAGCTYPDNPFRNQQPLAPRSCRWYVETRIGNNKQ